VSRTPGDVLLVLLYASILILVMVGGSFWIMFDLHHRMAF
jgi:cytochrome o ubiquinol oxidase operon protein cyoD